MACEWMWGVLPLNGKPMNHAISRPLKGDCTGHLEPFNPEGPKRFGALTASNYADLMKTHLESSAAKYLTAPSGFDCIIASERLWRWTSAQPVSSSSRRPAAGPH
jgi:hypothetical protein